MSFYVFCYYMLSYRVRWFTFSLPRKSFYSVVCPPPICWKSFCKRLHRHWKTKHCISVGKQKVRSLWPFFFKYKYSRNYSIPIMITYSPKSMFLWQDFEVYFKVCVCCSLLCRSSASKAWVVMSHGKFCNQANLLIYFPLVEDHKSRPFLL